MLDPIISKGEDLRRELATIIGYHLIDKRDIPAALLEIYDWMGEAIERIN